jgi:predicted N-acyltransferase
MNNEEAFFAGMYDGVTEVHAGAEEHAKMASAFDAGLLDGIASVNEPSIMDKIASLLGGEEVEEVEETEETEEVVEEAPEAEKTASAILMDVIRGEEA